MYKLSQSHHHVGDLLCKWSHRADGQSLSGIHRHLIFIYLVTILRPGIATGAGWTIYCLPNSTQPDNMRILCLHGYGTSPDIMKANMSKLKKVCDPSWEFHFLGGKVICQPDPGGEFIVAKLSSWCCVDINKSVRHSALRSWPLPLLLDRFRSCQHEGRS